MIIPILSLVISILALFFSVRNNIASRRPHLIFTEERIGEPGSEMNGFYLRNIGLGPAFNIEIPETYIDKYSFLQAFHNIPRNIPVGGSTLFHLAKPDRRFIDKDLIVSVTYEDHQGKHYRTTLKSMKHIFDKC
jgi:hypothetical protein